MINHTTKAVFGNILFNMVSNFRLLESSSTIIHRLGICTLLCIFNITQRQKVLFVYIH